MATVTVKERPFNHEETQRKVRHPLALVRKYIRRYIFLEGVALTLLFASIAFWIGLAIDYGLYKLDFDLRNKQLMFVEMDAPPLHMHGIDWLLELNDLDFTGASSLAIRAMILGVIVVALLFLGFTRVVTRWFREFNDRAVALVLERRFPKELGDRLITAIELADPKLSKKYGYSQAMVEKTILEAVDRIKPLPVASVFNWRRLYSLWFFLALTTIGMLVVTTVLFVGGSYAFADKPLSATQYACDLYDASATWTERNVLMQNTYWPRRAFLEIGRFQPSKENEHEMRVAKDDVRPELLVRAYEWVIADRDRDKAPHGWRALTWKDLSERKLIDESLLARVKIPADYDSWLLDPEELEPNLAAALLDTQTQERLSGELRQIFSSETNKQKIIDRIATAEVADFFDWTTWKMDKLVQQMGEARVAPNLRSLNSGADFAALEEIVAKLEELVVAPSMSRTLRKLNVPETVDVSFRGEMTSFADTYEVRPGGKYNVSLKELKDSTKFRFRARGDNYYTQPKVIALVGAPTPSKILIDKDEPAYIYHRLHGMDQMPLRGEKHLTRGMALSTTGESYTIELPLGSNLVIHVETDRLLRKERSVFIKDHPTLPEGFDHYRGKTPAVNSARSGFTLEMTNVTRKHEFSVEYFDEDNIKGRRRFKVLAHIDQEPQLGNLHITGVNLRKPKFKLPERKDNDKTPLRDLTELQSAFLITPDAILPFECMVRDDYGLVKVGYDYKYRVEDFDLFSQTTTAPVKKAPPKQQQPDPLVKKGGLGTLLGLSLLGLAGQRTDTLPEFAYTEGFVHADGFAQFVERKAIGMIALEELKPLLRQRKLATPWEFEFKDDKNPKNRDEIGFDLFRHLPALKTVNLEQQGQTYYLLKVAVQATDNNVETGSLFTENINGKEVSLRGNTKKNKNGYLNFLVVSENQLLSQIALEEELIAERLENAKEKVDAAITSLSEQQSRIGDANVDMDSVIIRFNEIRGALSDVDTKLKDAESAYGNIVEEMRINRVRKDRKSKIENLIREPLRNIINENPIMPFPATGSLQATQDAIHDAYRLVEQDANAKKVSDVAAHRKNMLNADKKLTQLSRDINKVLNAMQEGIVEATLIKILAQIERDQTKHHKDIRDAQEKLIRDILQGLGIDEPEKKDSPKDKNETPKDKKDEPKDKKETPKDEPKDKKEESKDKTKKLSLSLQTVLDRDSYETTLTRLAPARRNRLLDRLLLETAIRRQEN